MAVDAQRGLRELQRSEDQIDDVLRCIDRGGRLEHLDRMATIGKAGAACRVAQRLGPEERGRLASGIECRAAFMVERLAGSGGQAVHDLLAKVVFDIGELVGLEHVLEDVKAAAPVGLENVGVDAAVVGAPDRSAIAKAHGALLAVGQISLHGRFFGAVVGKDCAHGVVSRCMFDPCWPERQASVNPGDVWPHA